MKTLNDKKSFPKLYSGAIGAVTFLCSSVSCFAAPSALDTIKRTITEYYNSLSGIAIGLGMLLAVVALIVWFFFPSEKGGQTGKQWFIRILFCLAILLCLGGILSLIKDITAGQHLDTNTMFNVN